MGACDERCTRFVRDPLPDEHLEIFNCTGYDGP